MVNILKMVNGKTAKHPVNYAILYRTVFPAWPDLKSQSMVHVHAMTIAKRVIIVMENSVRHALKINI